MRDRPDILEVSGLFGYLNHRVRLLRDDRMPTLISGPNGSGKTTLLLALNGLLRLDFEEIARLPLDRVTLTYRSGRQLSVERAHADGRTTLVVRGRYPNREIGDDLVLDYSDDPFDEMVLPSWIERLDGDEFYDTRAQRFISPAQVRRRFGGRHPRALIIRRQNPWLTEFADGHPPTFIATGRLDVIESQRSLGVTRVGPSRPDTEARIVEYVQRIAAMVTSARGKSQEVGERADRDFAARALDKARESVKEVQLREKYEAISTLQQELHANGLTSESVDLAFPDSRTTPTERRILSVFVQDWEKKLEPLIPVHEKIQALRAVVGQKMKDKRLEFRGAELVFVSRHSGEELGVELLSSGEQHLIALFTMLLFDAVPGSLVIIDEPEISLHAAWKHEFLADISEVADVNDLQVVIATHSSGIINGRWDLVEEIGLGE